MLSKPNHHASVTNHTSSFIAPCFRCSDDDIVQVYYYLWALYHMYYIDLSDAENDYYAHTQTAANNFLGLHRYDANLQIPVGACTADKAYYAYGNALTWQSMLPYANLDNGTIPADNLGQAWYFGLNGGVTGHVPAAWKIYEHSGDLAFLSEADHWQDVVNVDNFDTWLNTMWEKSGVQHYFGAGSATGTLG
jgi:hypothetical protein